MPSGVRAAALAILVALLPVTALAVPSFARQTGQNCVACHAGGQFPELTPYGRMFKLTGYTIGARTVPLAVMGVASLARVANTGKSDDPGADFQKNGSPILATASLFLAGKIGDSTGAFIQTSYDNYGSQNADGSFHGKLSADNMDIRYADHLVGGGRDLVYGVSLNNSPSVSDPWNTAPSWMQYVPVPSPTGYQFVDGAAPYPGFGSGGNVAGLTAYLFWKRTLYLELGSYRSATGVFSPFSFNIARADTTMLSGSNNPYWRVALSHEWGANNLMIGATGMVAHVYDAGSDATDRHNLGRYRNAGLDAQYQYILDPHTVTVQFAYMRQTQDYSASTLAGSSPYFLADGVTPVAAFSPRDTTQVLRSKVSWIYRARYGGSLGYFDGTGTRNTLNQSSGYDSNGQITSTDPMATGITSLRVNGNLSGEPGTRGLNYEAFWLPWQYLRIGVQYTAYDRYNGASHDYDGFGRNAADNDTLFFYVWGAR